MKRDKVLAYAGAGELEVGRESEKAVARHLEEEVEAGGDLRGREGASERGLEVPDGGAGGEPDGRGPRVESPDLDLPTLLLSGHRQVRPGEGGW